MLTLIVLVIGAYLIGSIPFGVIVGRMRGFDPRAVGSGNIGMTNVARAGGASAAIITFVGDILKGAVPVIFARVAGFGPEAVAWTAIGAFVGSICSVFLRFNGGKGISAALGIWLAISPLAVLIPAIAFAIVFAIFQIMSLAALTAAIVMPPSVAILHLPSPYLLLAIVITALILLRFHGNIARLIRGEEPVFRPKAKGDGKTDGAVA
ncbi:MAG: glycerol-3-phosphate 1-O-acyltransferase PlsY [Candidatus Binataceae bacterium]